MDYRRYMRIRLSKEIYSLIKIGNEGVSVIIPKIIIANWQSKPKDKVHIAFIDNKMVISIDPIPETLEFCKQD